MAGRGWAAAALAMALGACAPGGPRPAADPATPPAIDESLSLETVPGAGVGTSLRFRFDWPDGLVGRCRSRRRVAGSGRPEPEREVTFRVRVEREADEVRVLTDDLAAADDRLLGEDALGPLVEVVEPDGRYRAARGVGDAVAGSAALRDRSPAETARAVREIEGRLAETWKLLVSAWAGRELPLGATYAATAPEAMPGGETVRVRIAIQADGRVPCSRADAAGGCVRLRLYSQPEERASDALVGPLLAILLPGAGLAPDDVVAEVASIATSAVVVTEPDTLIPHRFSLRRRYALSGSTPGEPELARERAEEITRVCTWR